MRWPSGLLFLCVGVIEHKLHSRNIEDMAGLIVSMPRVSVMMQIGMAACSSRRSAC